MQRKTTADRNTAEWTKQAQSHKVSERGWGQMCNMNGSTVSNRATATKKRMKVEREDRRREKRGMQRKLNVLWNISVSFYILHAILQIFKNILYKSFLCYIGANHFVKYICF